MDDAVAELINLTGTDAATALSYLEMCDGSVEQAFNLLSEMGPTSAAEQRNQVSQTNDRSSDSMANYDTGGGGGNIGSDFAFGGGMDDDVRAPDASKQLRLVDNADMDFGLPEAQQVHAFRDFNREAQLLINHHGGMLPNKGRGGQSMRNSSKVRGVKRDATSLSATQANENKDVLLSDLYRPPLEIMFTRSFQEAKQFAKKENKYILLNLQDEKEFDSMLLNRDTFGNETLKLLLQSLCVFCQHDKVSSSGHTLASQYKVDKFPYIGLIDPRTGACVWKRHGFVSAELLCDKISDYCSQHSVYEDEPPFPPAPPVPSLSSSLSIPMESLSTSHPSTSSSSSSSSSTATTVVAATITSSLETTSLQLDVISFKKEFDHVVLENEPEKGSASSTRVAFNCAGVFEKPVQFTRIFNKSDKVSCLFKFASETLARKFEEGSISLKSVVGETSNNQFDIKLAFGAHTSLRTFIEQTIDEAGAGNSKLLITY